MMESTEKKTRLSQKFSNRISVIQITDTHIFDDGTSSFNDYDTSASLMRVINKIIESESDVDLILLTGDLVHEPTSASYQKLADHLSIITTPIFILPGNHDVPELMKYIMGLNGYGTGNIIKFDDWVIILLNTCVRGKNGGELSHAELSFLQRSLEVYEDTNTLIALHHPPVLINSSWMDAMSLTNAKYFLSLIDDHKQVRGIIWGHIHQEFEDSTTHAKLLGTPSTCLQFKPGSTEFIIDDKAPAYRKLILGNDGVISSNVIYISD
ncbi:MAG: phosphodiesterase [Legionellales bacterium]|nr:phosphodiesterase [Legionellales bacterium]